MFKVGVITFPGSNCDDDCVHALQVPHLFEVKRLWHKDTNALTSYDLIVLPGGFSYGDYLRSGAIAALSPIMAEVKKFAEGGGFVLGTCNGFQTLCETGMLPGALVRNESLLFSCRDVLLEVVTPNSPWTCEMKEGERITLPIAHGEGRYVVNEEDYRRLCDENQCLLTYVDNPNGSLHNIAGVCNSKRNVFGLMPHPERATDLGSKDGMKIWKSIASFFERRQP